MVLGVGVDMVDINEVKRYMGINDSFERHTFTTAEQRIAENVPDKAQYYAGLFAVKEAVFKALGHRTKEKLFDFRCVETLHHKDGAPYVRPNKELQKYMDEAGVREILVSITNEKHFAVAFAIAQD